jgi:hypothetical protein
MLASIGDFKFAKNSGQSKKTKKQKNSSLQNWLQNYSQTYTW